MQNLAEIEKFIDPGRDANRISAFQREITAYLERYPHTRQVDLLLTDLNGCFRGKRIPFISLHKIETGCYFPASVYAMSITGSAIEAAGLGQENGEPDHLCLPVPGSLNPSAADSRRIAQLQLTMLDTDGTPLDAEPRNVLNRVWQRLRACGIHPVVAVELEFYLVDRRRNAAGMPQPPFAPGSRQRQDQCQVYSLDNLDHFAPVLNDIERLARMQRLPTNGAVAESSPGQFEINLNHTDNVLKACDQALQLKRLVRLVAENHQLNATFMAKPYDAWTGSGMHIHLSLLDPEGNNSLTGAEGKLMARALGGMLDLLPASMALLAPNVNAFRRFQPGGFVPLRANWGYNNRTVALRIPCSDAGNHRLEYRVAGADANPYLVVAAMLAGILHGLDNPAPLTAPVTGNGALGGGEPLPLRQSEALRLFAADTVLPALLGKRFCRVFHTCKAAELSQFERRVTETEIDWMLNNA